MYFGDAGSPAVLHLVGAERAACAVIALDSPGANYRAVWAMAKHFPGVKVSWRCCLLPECLGLERGCLWERGVWPDEGGGVKVVAPSSMHTPPCSRTRSCASPHNSQKHGTPPPPRPPTDCRRTCARTT